MSAISPISITISIICYLLFLCIVICLSVVLVVVVVYPSSCLVIVVAFSRALHLEADNIRLLVGNCQMHEILYLPRSLLLFFGRHTINDTTCCGGANVLSVHVPY